jgi:4-hydroxy-3-polyprenylbenzoate decarboxylase
LHFRTVGLGCTLRSLVTFDRSWLMLMTRRLIVAITGASGVALGVRLLDYLKSETDIETHLMVSPAGWLTIDAELDVDRRTVEQLATRVYSVREVGACIASGSFETDGMVVVPCSMRTLAAIAHGLSDNLITRAADVTLKERRRLVLVARETPLNLAHLRNMTAVTEMGGIVFPPVPALYQRPASIDQMIDHMVGRVLDLFGIRQSLNPSWQGVGGGGGSGAEGGAGGAGGGGAGGGGRDDRA